VTAPAPEKEGADGGGADETDKEIMESDESIRSNLSILSKTE
jgi:hypothetical protein